MAPDLSTEVKEFLERLGRTVEVTRADRLTARHRTALLEEKTELAILGDGRGKPLVRGINILGPDHPGLDRDRYPQSFYWHEFLDWTVNADGVVTSLIDDPTVCSKAASFIPQHLEQDGRRLSQNALQFFLQDWLPDPEKRLLAVLAPAGYGKTVLTCALAHRMGENYLEDPGRGRSPFPYLINFGDFRRLSAFEGMILQSLEDKNVTDYTSGAFAYLVTRQRVVLILDGFDELLEERPKEAQKNLRELIETLEGRGKVIVTARSTFFRTSDDVTDFLEYSLDASQVSVVDLLPFDQKQRREFVARRTSTGTEQNRILRFVESAGLEEAMGSPLLLNETVEALLSEDGAQLNQARGRDDLFGALERSVYERERTRKNHLFGDDVQRRFLEDLAQEMLEHSSRGFDFEEVQVAALDATGDLDPDLAELDRLAHHHFLTVSAGSQEVRFNHQVFREYFQARALLGACMNANDGWVMAMLAVRPLPEAVMKFAVEIDKQRILPRHVLRLATEGATVNQRVVQNVAQLLSAYGSADLIVDLISRVPRDLSLELSLEGSDLLGVDWSERFFSRLELSGVSLRDADFSGSAIHEFSLTTTDVTGARFLRCAIDSVTVEFGQRVFGTANALQVLAGLGADCGLDDEAAVPALVADYRADIVGLIRGRLNRFYIPGTGGVEGSRWDSSIQERNLLGGLNQAQRKFVHSKVVPALIREGVLARRRQHGIVIYDLTNAAEDDARRLIERDELTGAVAAVIDRLAPEPAIT